MNQDEGLGSAKTCFQQGQELLKVNKMSYVKEADLKGLTLTEVRRTAVDSGLVLDTWGSCLFLPGSRRDHGRLQAPCAAVVCI